MPSLASIQKKSSTSPLLHPLEGYFSGGTLPWETPDGDFTRWVSALNTTAMSVVSGSLGSPFLQRVQAKALVLYFIAQTQATAIERDQPLLRAVTDQLDDSLGFVERFFLMQFQKSFPPSKEEKKRNAKKVIPFLIALQFIIIGTAALIVFMTVDA